MYEHSAFENKGIEVYDMEYPDGSNPPDDIIVEFIELCEQEISRGKAVAVHCRAGLGRTGTLIGLYMMHKHDFTAKQAIAWLRLCRPGSVVGDQQQFMQNIESDLPNIIRNGKSSKAKKSNKADKDFFKTN